MLPPVSIKFRQGILALSLSLCFVLLSAIGSFAQPTWTTGYPQILSGASSVDIKVQTNSTGTIYYAMYKTVQTGITSALLKSDALGGTTNANLVRRASAAMTANTLQTLKQTSLPDNITYYIYVVAESNGVLMANNLISYTARFFPKRQQELYNFSNSAVAAHLMYFPEDYYKTSTTYPLLVFLGGSGQLTHGGPADLAQLTNTGLPMVIKLGKEIPMIVASPQGIFTWAGSASGLDAYIEFLKVTYRVNASQIFLTGMSDGGVGAFQYADVHPTKLRGVIPVSTWPSGALPVHFLNLPVWGFMGNTDSNGELINFIYSLQQLGGIAKYTEYPGGHLPQVWNTVYDGSRGDDIYQWMQNILNSPPGNNFPVVNAGVDRTVSLPLTQLVITGTASDADGTIASRTWTQISGPSVTMTTTNTLSLTLTNITAGTYVFQLRVIDDDNAATADQVTVYVTAAGAVAREFYVNVTWAANKQGSNWNDFVTTSGGVVGNSLNLFDNHNIPSTLAISVIAPFQDGANNHGVIPGALPNNIMLYYLRSTQTKVGTLKLSGLTVGNKYDLAIMSSNADTGYPSDTRLTATGQSVTVNTVNATGNSNVFTYLLAVAPNASGQINLTVAPATTASNNVGVINALVIKEKIPLGGNQPPVVNAGSDRTFTLPLSQLQLTGTASDPDGTIASLLWTKVSGPAVTMTNTTTSTLTLTSLAAGTYVFQLSAQDNSGVSAADQITVIVNNNVAPVVNAGSDRTVTLPLSQLQLTGTATDPDGTIASLLWTKLSGPAVTLTNATTATLTLTNLLAGTYVFQLRAQDNGGAATADPITVIVNPAPTGIREFDINVTWEWNKQGGLPWNDFITTNGGVVGNSKTLVDKNGVASTVSISITAPFQDGANNHGVTPGLYPNNVMMYYLRSTQSKKGALKLAGLNTAKRYDLSIMSSNIDVWYPSDTRLTVQGQAAYVNARSNATQLVNFTNIAPTASGEIPILVEPSTTSSTNVGVINAIILKEHDVIPGGRTAEPEVTGNPERPSTPLEDFVNVFPNPVDDHVNVEISSSLPAPETFSIEFIDVRGAQVYARMLESQDGMNHVSEKIPTDFLQSGLYIVAVHSRQNGIKYFKILKR